MKEKVANIIAINNCEFHPESSVLEYKNWCKVCNDPIKCYESTVNDIIELFGNYENKIKKALDYAMSGTTDGDHHKMWVIDQMVRALTGCPMTVSSARDCNGKRYVYEHQGTSEEYLTWIAKYCDGEDGVDTYEWDEGIAP